MPANSQIVLFIVAALVLLLTPGPAVLYIVTRSVQQGRVAGFVSSLGIQVGSLCHVVAAALGVSAIFLASAVAFSVLKYIGAAYLIYLGVRCFLQNDLPAQSVSRPAQSLKRIFAEGVVVNLLNPKTAVFFLAFLPQFVDVANGPVWRQILVLGAIFACIAAVTETAWALAAGTIGKWLRTRPAVGRNMRFFSGGVYIALGLTTAFSGSGRNK